MKVSKYRELNKEKLEQKLKELNLELIKSKGMLGVAKFERAKGKKAKGGSDLTKRIRREIARVKTILIEKGEEE